MRYVLAVIAIILAAIRIGGVTHIAYQAAAHLFVGGLIAAGVVKGRRAGRYEIALAVALSVVEVLVFFKIL